MTVKFQEPKNNWIKLYLKDGEFDLEFDASSIPENPINELISSLLQISNGISSTVVWNIEPGKYFFKLDKQNEKYRLEIFQNSDNKSPVLLYALAGNFNEIVLPFYRAIKNLVSYEIREKDWPRFDKEKIEKLSLIVSESKTAHNRR